MNEEHQHDLRIEQWATCRRDPPEDTGEFTREVMARVAAVHQPDKGARRQAAPRLQRVALTTVCAAAGLGKFLIVLRLAI